MSSVPKWGGSKAQAWTREVLARYGRVCALAYPGICTTTATEADHIVPRSLDLARQYDVTNGRPACRACNAYRGDGRNDPPAVVDTRTFFESRPEPQKDSAGSPPRAPEKTDLARLIRFPTEATR